MTAKICRNWNCKKRALRGKFCTQRCGYLFAVSETALERWCSTCNQWVNETVRRNCEHDGHALEVTR